MAIFLNLFSIFGDCFEKKKSIILLQINSLNDENSPKKDVAFQVSYLGGLINNFIFQNPLRQ
jgi:hypothetical protein